MTRILLVEDDKSISHVITAALRDEGWSIDSCDSIAQRDLLLAQNRYMLMLTDVMLSDGDGIKSLTTVKQGFPDMPVIILSAQNTLDTAVRASETEAFEYFPKPFDLDELVDAASQAINSSKADTIGLSPTSDADNLPLVGRSPAMQDVYRMITRVLRNDLTVLLLGESGTGKELVADAIHNLGHRREKPFVAVNMAAIPAELIESELFGHEKGAFTGAVNQYIGKFEQANGGTLFLDEIGDMPMQAQTRLLRALQSGRITRVGGKQDITLDVRIICATNKDFRTLIEQGDFREDLYYRINVVPIDLPPLRERREDIDALVKHFARMAVSEGLPLRELDKAARDLLRQQYWSGNVRELKNLIYRIAVFSRDETVTADMIAPFLDDVSDKSSAVQTADLSEAVKTYLSSHTIDDGQVYLRALEAFEVPLLRHIMKQCGGNQLKAAETLGINRNTLRKKLTNYDIDADELRHAEQKIR